MRKLFGMVAALALIVAIGGCSLAGATHQSSQAAVTDHSAGDVSQMPSGFRNFADKCVEVQGEWFAVFTTSDGGNNNNLASGVTAVPDPKCTHDGP